ncbi:MAG: YidC/Oxa1 family membrane protein insertase [Defluviitaleaceae bacterium]|nr:YidC/Oxa1 family membrane protein insertase [Defluviitaleaceae bacterium]
MFGLGFIFGGQRMVQNEPGMFIGPIAAVFGVIIDFIFGIVYNFTVYHSLGLSIILMTLIVRSLMLPLAFKQQKSMMAMQRLNPEMTKIRKKYPNKDVESQQKMNAEIQKLYKENNVNPFGGCLPLFIQMPLFFGLSFIMNQSFLYVSRLGDLYTQISRYLINEVPGYTNFMVPLALPRVPQRMLDNQEIDISIPEQMNRILNVFEPSDWNAMFASIPDQYLPPLLYLYEQKLAIENFFGLALTEVTGLGWPGIVIPILAVATAIITSKLTMAMSLAVANDERMRQQQKMMMVIMPVMMGVMTIGLPTGVGIFWITTSVFQIVQQLVFNHRAGIKSIGNTPVS